MDKISIVLPVYNEESALDALYQQLRNSCEQSRVDYEIIFVDDGSTDHSLDQVKKLGRLDERVKYLSFSRNFGHQNALFAGMSYSSGDAVITMDADMQHPPSLIPQMIDLWRKGAEVVYTIKEETNLKFKWRMTLKIYYWFFSKISGLKLNFGQSDFRLLDRKVLSVILQIPEYHKFLRGQVEWVGFRQEGVTYRVDARHSGKSKLDKSRLPFALDGIFAFSRYPLRLLMMLGLITGGISFIYVLSQVILWFLVRLGIVRSWPMVTGWITLVVAIFFLGSLQLIAIGVLGEYIGRTYDQTKGRPVFIIRESSFQKNEEEGHL